MRVVDRLLDDTIINFKISYLKVLGIKI